MPSACIRPCLAKLARTAAKSGFCGSKLLMLALSQGRAGQGRHASATGSQRPAGPVNVLDQRKGNLMPSSAGARPVVVFDLGGVLIDWNPRYLYRTAVRATRPAWSASWPRSATPRGTSELDRGRPFAEAVAELAARHPHERARIEAYHHALARDGGRPDPRHGRDPGGAGRAGVPLYALTNWSAETFALARASRPTRSSTWFREHLRLGRARLIKPDPRIFRHCCSTRIGRAAPQLPVHRRQRRRTSPAAAAARLRMPSTSRRPIARVRTLAGAEPADAAGLLRRVVRSWLGWELLGLAAAGVVVAAGVWPGSPGARCRRLEARSGSPASPGRSTVVRDRWAIPHIEAARAEDAYLALGFVHAQDRLWQMEFEPPGRRRGGWRRSWAGRRCRSTGFMRTLGLCRRAAEASVEHLGADARRDARGLRRAASTPSCGRRGPAAARVPDPAPRRPSPGGRPTAWLF